MDMPRYLLWDPKCNTHAHGQVHATIHPHLTFSAIGRRRWWGFWDVDDDIGAACENPAMVVDEKHYNSRSIKPCQHIRAGLLGGSATKPDDEREAASTTQLRLLYTTNANQQNQTHKQTNQPTIQTKKESTIARPCL
jgi:hypothetical protein